MPFAYSNNGLSFRGFDSTRPDIFTLEPGEILFDTPPTSAQLEAAFPGYAAAQASASLVQQAQVALAVGLQIVSTGTPGVSGTYALDAASQQKILTVFAAIGAGIQTGNVNYPDASGAIHTFTPAEFQAFTAAVYAYVQQLDEVVMGVTGVALPVQPVTIA